MSLTIKNSDLHSHLGRKKKHTGLPSIFDQQRAARTASSAPPHAGSGSNSITQSPPSGQTARS